ncbi:MAG: phosphatidylglycerophosphatase [Bacillales bacterium]|jgi:phosphatidylglycerophosphatase A|nr:phosphatidylglycerophosphatase [Bacillales bacterium]
MGKGNNNITSKILREEAIKMLNERDVQLEDIAEVAYQLQVKYAPNLTLEECMYNLNKVLEKREVLHAILVGYAMDTLAEKKLLPYPLQELVETDEPLFGIDETLVFGMVNIYGSIGMTSFGYVDKAKTGIIADLDSNEDRVNTFMDDIVGGLAAATSSRIAHRLRNKEEAEVEENN